jgi:fructose/tagatose bisphosphate aldolase
MLALGKALGDAQRGWVAIGHNMSDLVALKAVAAAARALNVPGLELPRASAISFGVREIATVAAALREETGQPIFLNADHTHSLEHALEAAKAGYDMIGFDVSTSPLEKNIELTQAAVEAVKSISPRITVEGELGFVGSGSEIHESVPESSRLLMKADDAKRFCRDLCVPQIVGVPLGVRAIPARQDQLRSDTRQHKAVCGGCPDQSCANDGDAIRPTELGLWQSIASGLCARRLLR